MLFFSPYSIDDTSDDGAQEPDASAGAYYQEGPDGQYYWIEPADPAVDYYYYPDGAYYYVETADDQE